VNGWTSWTSWKDRKGCTLSELREQFLQRTRRPPTG
jgi:hypothetical protein